jgi:hypothetical protein
MPLGPGKYDEQATRVRVETEATAVVLVVIDGVKGSGFSVQAPAGFTDVLPSLLRGLADSIEADLA